jgi:hypothetical protein
MRIKVSTVKSASHKSALMKQKTEMYHSVLLICMICGERSCSSRDWHINCCCRNKASECFRAFHFRRQDGEILATRLVSHIFACTGQHQRQSGFASAGVDRSSQGRQRKSYQISRRACSKFKDKLKVDGAMISDVLVQPPPEPVWCHPRGLVRNVFDKLLVCASLAKAVASYLGFGTLQAAYT